MTKKETYNGWPNRATWNVVLWLSNDEGLYNHAREERKAVESDPHKRKFSSIHAQTMCEELWPTGRTPDDDKLDDVHWADVARAVREL